MQLNEYQAQLVSIWETQKTPDEQLLFCAVGMAEESGKAMGKVKRWMRGEVFDREAYLKELGDTLAYLAIAAHSQGFKLDELSLNGNQSTASNLGNAINLYRCSFNLLDYVFEDYYVNAKSEWLKELMGDVYGAIFDCTEGHETNSNLSEVMQLNLSKLADRKARLGTLRGSGDNR